MRILLVQGSTYVPALGGANKANRELLEQLAARGHDCRVIGTAGERATTAVRFRTELAAAGVAGAAVLPEDPGVVAFRHAGVAVEAVLDGARLRAHVAARIRETSPDRVLVSSEDPAQVLLRAAVDAAPGRVIYIAHTTLHLPFGPDGFLDSPAGTDLLRRTAGIIAVSGFVQEYFRRWAGLESTLLRFPVYGTGPFPELGSFDSGFVTLINPCAVKGIAILLELARRCPDVPFAAVPTWGTTAEDRAALAALPNVEILPPSPAIDDLFTRTRVLLAPSLWGEAFGQVAVEAMLRGIPVLASDAGGLPEAKLGVDYVLPVRPIRRYEERFDDRKIPVAAVPEQDVGPWERALRGLLADRGRYEALSRQSRRAALDFVAGLGIAPFEEYLESLRPRSAAAGERPLKILLVQPLTYLFNPGGAHKANRLFMEGLAALGHECRVVAPRSEPGPETREEFLARLAAQGIPVLAASESEIVFRHAGVQVHATTSGIELAVEAVRQVRELEPDWVVVSEDRIFVLLQELLMASPGRVVCFAHSPATLPFGPGSFAPDAKKSGLIRRAAGILTVSRYMQDYIRRWGGMESTVVYSPVYGSGPFPRLADFDRGFVTMINPSAIKGISIFAELARRLPEVPFAAVPTWGTTDADRALLATLSNVTLLPPVDDIDELFSRTRALLVPSLWGEAFGQIVVEAMLRGVPVLASDFGALPEAKLGVDYVLPVRPIERYEEQLDEKLVPVPVVPEQDVGPWEAALRRLLADRGLYERISEQSRQAAARFVAGLGIEPYERFFRGLRPAAAGPAAPPDAAPVVRRKLDELSPERLELLARKLKKKDRPSAQPAIPRLPRPGAREGGTDAFPLSFAQQRMWFLHALEPESPAYNEFMGVHLAGRLRVEVLEASLNEIARRHETLRTRFAEYSGRPVQVVSPPSARSLGFLPVVDLGGLPAGARRAEVARLTREERQRPFDLERGPVLRVALVAEGDGEALLLISAHHILADIWSIMVLARELSTLYPAVLAGRPSPLPELPLQYADFAVWQRQWMQGEVLEGHLAWWRERLAGMPPVLLLPTDRPRPAVQSSRGSSVPVSLPLQLSEALPALARREEATPFMAILAGLQALLHRWTGQDDVPVGSPIANRNRRELEDLIGCFINTLVHRGDLSGRPTGRELLARVRTAALGAYAHQDLPFELLVEHLQPERSLSHGPLFQVIFMLQNTPGSALELTEVATEPLPVPSGTAKLDLVLAMVRGTDGAFYGNLEYSLDLFDPTTIGRLLEHFQRLLAGLVECPDRPVAELPLLGEAERHQLLREWNRPTPRPPQGTGLYRLFRAQVERAPDAVAVVCEERCLTYGELDRRAARLASRLRALGVGPETPVGLCLERSLDLPVGILAILRAGGAYVPLDPAYPRDHLAYILEDAGVTVLLTRSGLLDGLPEGRAREVHVNVEEPAAGCAEPAAPAEIDGRTAAYVIYTSGSTGRPKGAVVTHDNVARLFASTADWFGFGAADVWTLFHSYAFDFSVWELWGALLHGGRVVVVPYWTSRSPGDFHALLARERVTVLNQTPSAFRQLIREEESGRAADDPALRWVVFGGEALEFQSLRPWFERHGDRRPRLVNMYGITETTVHVTFRPVAAADLEVAANSAIGSPIPDLRIHILDAALQPVPIGVPGEMLVGGAGVSRGYLHRPGLTAERFVPDPFAGVDGGEPGARLYRTGDLARHLKDGSIDFLGRIDHQVKIRGFRIELGEIEAVLSAHPAVREAVVLVREDGGDRRLVACVVPHAADTPDTAAGLVAALRELLREKLPEHMVPAGFVALERLPLTSNGKVDRRALERLSPAETGPADGYVAPRTPLEERLARIWAGLLGVERVGAEDNFFDLGGDSIQAVRLVSRIREELGEPAAGVRVQDIFKHQSVGSLAAWIEEAAPRTSLAKDHAAGLELIERLRQAVLADAAQRARLPEDCEDFYPLSGIEKGMVYYSLLLPEQPVYHDQYIQFLTIPDVGAFLHAFELLIDRHPIFRSSFHLYDFQEPMKVVHRRLRPAWRVEDLSGLPEGARRHRLESYCAADLAEKFSFDGGFPWRFRLFRLEGEVCCAVLSCHHAILDGWSNVSFWVEMNELCARRDILEVEHLPRLASDYKDYLAITLGKQSSAKSAAFWRQTLAGHARNKLPFNRARTREQEARGMRSLQRRMSGGLLDALRARALGLHVSLKALCLGAHLYLLHVTAAEDDVVTGTVSHDRPGIRDGDRILGCFLNSVPVRMAVGKIATGAELAAETNRYLAASKEHEMPLVDVAALVGPADAADNPIFDTLFNFLDFHLVEKVERNVLFDLEAASPPGVGLDLDANEMTNTLFDLEVSTTLDAFFVKIKYSPRHFDAADVERALAFYERILEGLSARPDAPLRTESLLTPAEREEIVHRFNDTAADFPDLPIHRLFEEQAARTPGATAVVCGGRPLSYRDLDLRANRLAWHLLDRGVAPGENVGVAFARSPELIVALLAVLKAGASYVPLEPDYPPARKGYILWSSAVSRVVADREYEVRLPEGGEKRQVTFVVPGAEDLAAHGDAPPGPRPRPDDLAYTIYTSGSTGRPKGVMIEHLSAANLIHWVNRRFAVGPEDRLLMVSSVCFDLSVYDVFGGLGAGAAVVVARQEDLRDPARLRRLVVDERITFWNSTPSTLGHLVKYLEDVEPGFRQEEMATVFLSGDWIPLGLPQRARRFFPNARVVSLGGATEATVWSNVYPIDRIDDAWASIPYGRPIDNSSFYILDAKLDLVPAGVVGGLYIGGVGVARGYAGDPARTAESFLPDPFAGAGRRMYRTGDLGRMMPDGNMEFLGRADHQVKIRGFRVELGEIESQLLRHPEVREAVVVDRVDRAGEKFLCAYVVAPSQPAPAELRRWLAESLPEYMIPATFVALPALPLTANGKVDRRALPEPGVGNIRSSAEYAAPSGEIEAALVAIWEEVLGARGIGVRHEFFELGGHSLSAVQMLTRIRRRFGVDLPLRELFEAATVEGMAQAVAARLRSASGAVAERIPRRRESGPAPLSFAQERFWFLHRLAPESAAFHLGGAVRLTGPLRTAALAAALDEVVRRHEALRTRFQEIAERPVQVVDPPAPLGLPVADLGALAPAARERELRRLAGEEVARPFDLARGWPLRVRLLRLGEEEHAALFVLHHIAGDGWSMGLLIRELGEIYGALSAGAASPRPEPPIQYADFAVWQRERLRGEYLEEQLAWWRSRLAGPLPVLELPTQRPRPEAPRFQGAAQAVHVPRELRDALDRLGHSEGATPFMTLLAAFNALLHLYTGEEDLLVGTNVANRDRGEIEGLIGFFVNNLVLRTDLSGAPTFRELLRRVRETALGAFAHQEVPFEKVLEAVAPQRQTAYAPLFQVMFVLQSFPAPAREVAGLRITPVDLEARTANFDLTLMLSEEADGLDGSLLYDSDLFTAPAMARMAEHLLALLRAVTADPDLPLAAVSLGGEADERQLVSAFSEDF